MAYTNNVPQGNQQIASTQAPIQANFDFIQKAVGQEHFFPSNASNNPALTYHMQASMPNQALLGSFPTSGTNGVYYVSSGIAYFYDGTLNYPLSPFCVRAAVNFNGISGTSVRSSFNVSSVVRNAVGDYTINFTTALPSNNYLVQCTGMRNTNGDVCNGSVAGNTTYGTSVSTASVRVLFNGGSSSLTDVLMANVIIFGG